MTNFSNELSVKDSCSVNCIMKEEVFSTDNIRQDFFFLNNITHTVYKITEKQCLHYFSNSKEKFAPILISSFKKMKENS